MFIIDFDDTLFDTQRFKKARLDALLACGVSEAIFTESYIKARNNMTGAFTYSDRRHAEILAEYGFDEEKIYEAFMKITAQLPSFLFPDTILFLEKLKTLQKPLILLSLGDSGFQETKVRGAKIHKYFDRRFMVSETKLSIMQHLLQQKQDEMVWFIDDKIDETREIAALCPAVHPLLKVSGSIPLPQYEASGMPYFANLLSIYDYVATPTAV
ncbi:MAG TPA: hypothetical protein VEA18_02510 [Candidatus Kapabacteria bacterium]|nr:hypothetical protein [Candidatus Kapabacteria bacterium]